MATVGEPLVRVAAPTVAVLVALGCGSSALAPADGGPALDGAEEAPAAGACEGFPMPNPVAAGLPNPASYTASADGTVTDDVTGLTWEATVTDTVYMQDAAVAYCLAKGAGWRLPTRLELVSLVDYTIAAPGPTINAIFPNTPATVFWTGSAYYGDAGDEWDVGFDEGYSDYGIINQSNLVRCVLPPAPKCRSARYVAQGGGLVLDQATGLTWQQTPAPGSYSWSDANAYCAGLGAGWRAPSLTEAQTIIDDVREDPAVDPGVFPGTPVESFWTSSPKADDTNAAWYVDVFYGATDSDVTARLFRVRCVR